MCYYSNGLTFTIIIIQLYIGNEYTDEEKIQRQTFFQVYNYAPIAVRYGYVSQLWAYKCVIGLYI